MPSPEGPQSTEKTLNLGSLPNGYIIPEVRVQPDPEAWRELVLFQDKLDRDSEYFTELDSRIQRVLMIGAALESNKTAIYPNNMRSATRRKMKREYERSARELGMSTDYRDVLAVGPYDINGENVKAHREKLLATGAPKESVSVEPTVLVVFPPRPVDNKVAVDTIDSVAFSAD